MDPKSPAPSKHPVLEGRYANHFKVGFNAFEFVIDFGQYDPENDKAEPCARIYTGPAYAKAMLRVVQETIRQYENQYGPIDEDPEALC